MDMSGFTVVYHCSEKNFFRMRKTGVLSSAEGTLPIMIKNEQEYYAALKEVSPLYDLDPPDGSEEARKLDELSTLIMQYEAKNYPLD
ncbi:hypothetical protein ACOY50_07710 [Enterobacter asburiae]|uniref:hypothetical protein n=1 Tax=Enterobacter asburiae TaxID=61645 RepID=UPI003BED91F2